MADFPNSSLSFTSGFVDETSTDSTLDEQTEPLDSFLPDPLLMENNSEDSTDASNLSTSFQEESPEVDSMAKFQDRLEDEPGTKFQEDSLEVDSSTKFQKNSLVFAKLSGHSDPPWPARVAKVCWKNNIHYGYEVFFYGTYQVGIVLTDKVWAYNEESVSKFSNPRISSLRKRGDFSRGLIEIRDCPDIAPSRDIPESASQIAKKLIRSSATNDIKVQRKRANSVEAVATSTPDRSNGGAEDQRTNKSSKTKMTGINKIQDKKFKSNPSSWILSPLRKLESSSDDEEVRPNKKMKLSTNDDNITAGSKEATRRSERVKKIPYWKRLENNNKTADQSLNTPKKKSTLEDDYKTAAQSLNTSKENTSLEHDIKNMSLQSQNKSKSTYQLRNASKEVEVKKYTKKDKPNTFNPSTNNPNNCRKSTETTPRPQKKAAEIRNTPARRAAAADSGGREEASTKSNIKVLHNSNSGDVKGPRSTKSVESDCRIVKEEPLSDNPVEWTVAQTVSSIIRMDPTIEPDDLQPIREHKIDGSVLIQLNFSDLVTYCKVKVGPAIKIRNIVKTLKPSELNSETNNEHF